MKRSSRSLSRRFGGFLVTALVTLGLLAGLSACARRDVVELADRQPQLDLAEFFRGDSIAYGIFEDRFGNLRRQFRVNMTGTVEGDILTLAEDFLYDDGERAERTWVIEIPVSRPTAAFDMKAMPRMSAAVPAAVWPAMR